MKKKNNNKRDNFIKAILDYKKDYIFNRSYASEIFEKFAKEKVKDICEFGYFKINNAKESIPLFTYQLDTKKITLDLIVLAMDFGEWVNMMTNFFNSTDHKDILVKIVYLGEGEDKPCINIMHKKDYEKAMGKAS